MTRQEILKVAKPISFNDYMINCAKAGTVKAFLQKANTQPEVNVNISGFCEQNFVYDSDKKYIMCKCCNHIIDTEPKYNIGDILYVREYAGTVNGETVYRADYDTIPADIKFWPPSNMSKSQSRMFILVTDVNVCKFRNIDKDVFIAMGNNPLDWFKHHIGYSYSFEILQPTN